MIVLLVYQSRDTPFCLSIGLDEERKVGRKMSLKQLTNTSQSLDDEGGGGSRKTTNK